MIHVISRGIIVAIMLSSMTSAAHALEYALYAAMPSETFYLLDQPIEIAKATELATPTPESQTRTPLAPAKPLPGGASSSNLDCGEWAESICTRINYFYWDERLDGVYFAYEDDPRWTQGYEPVAIGDQFRSELFRSQAVNDTNAFFVPRGTKPTLSVSNYLGVHGETGLLFQAETWPELKLFDGVGTRLWVFSDLPNELTVDGGFVVAYQETWCTVYPYVGLESKQDSQAEMKWYGRSRIGLTTVTLDGMDVAPAATLNSRPGLTGQAEGGLRGQRLFAGAYFEFLGWSQLGGRSDAPPPTSKQLTVGLKTGVNF